MKKLNNRGLSLVELLVTVAIASVIIVTAMTLLVNGTKLYGNGLNEVNLQDEVQITLNQVEDILMEGNSEIKYDAANHILAVTKNEWNSSINQYQEVVEYVSFANGCLWYQQDGGETSLMAEYVDDFSVNIGSDGKKVVLSISMSNGRRTYSSNQTVSLRNSTVVSDEIGKIAATTTAPEGGESTDGSEGTGATATPAASDGTAPTSIPNTPTPTNTPAPTNTPKPVATATPAAKASEVDGKMVDSNKMAYSWGGGGHWWSDGTSTSYTLQFGTTASSVTDEYISVNGVIYHLGNDYIDIGNGLKAKIQSLGGGIGTFLINTTDGYSAGTVDVHFIVGSSDNYTVSLNKTIVISGNGTVEVK